MALPEEYHRGSSAWAWARSNFGVMSLVDSSVKVPYESPTIHPEHPYATAVVCAFLVSLISNQPLDGA